MPRFLLPPPCFRSPARLLPFVRATVRRSGRIAQGVHRRHVMCIAGLAIGYMSHDGSFFSQEEMALATGIMMGGAGAVVGAIAGVAEPGERWKAVPLASLRAGLARDGGMTAAYTIRF